MSAYVKGFVVVLEENIHPDIAERIRQALFCIAGVIAVEPELEGPNDTIIAWRIKQEISKKLREAGV